MEWQTTEDMVRKDFEQFTRGAEKLICPYARNKHIHMATQLAMQAFEGKPYYKYELNDFIHGMNHLFFFGVIAGKALTKEGE